jgi:hypothetical protein
MAIFANFLSPRANPIEEGGGRQTVRLRRSVPALRRVPPPKDVRQRAHPHSHGAGNRVSFFQPGATEAESVLSLPMLAVVDHRVGDAGIDAELIEKCRQLSPVMRLVIEQVDQRGAKRMRKCGSGVRLIGEVFR